MIEKLFIITALMGLIMAVMNVTGANIYDLRQARKQRQFSRNPHARRYRHRPLISVMVLSRNSEPVIEQCLRSLVKSTYQKLEIIIVDNASRDGSSKLVKKFMLDHPKKTIKLFAKRMPSSDASAIAAGYKRYGQGELILVCQAGQMFDKRALSQALRHFNSEHNIASLSFNQRVASKYQTVGVFQKYENLLRNRAKKFSSVTNSGYTSHGDVIVYRREVFTSLFKLTKKVYTYNNFANNSATQFGNKKMRAYYASDAIVYTQPISSFTALWKQRYHLQLGRLQSLYSLRKLFFSRNPNYTKFFTWFYLPFAVGTGLVAVCVPILLTYFVYLTIELHEPTLLLSGWIVLGLFLLFAVWGDEHFRLRQKIAYSLCIPITYSLFYILSFVQIFVILRACLPRTRQKV